MNKQYILELIKAEKPFLRAQFGVEEIALFGSYARGDQKSGSDVDIFVSIKNKTLGNYFSLMDYLEKKLHKKIDLVTRHNNLSERFVRIINKDLIYV